MTENKTKQHKGSVKEFINGVSNDTRRTDAKVILKLLRSITGKQAKMWGASIIGFDKYHYKYDSGREGDMCMIGFSPRSTSLVLYLISGFKSYGSLLKKLGKHRSSKACLYINKLADVDMKVLEEILKLSYQFTKEKYSE